MCFYLRNWQVTFLLYTLGVFISEYTAKAFTEPRDYRVVFLIQKGSDTAYYVDSIGFEEVPDFLGGARQPEAKRDVSLREQLDDAKKQAAKAEPKTPEKKKEPERS